MSSSTITSALGGIPQDETMTQPNVDFRSELATHARALQSMARCLVSSDEAEDIAQQTMVNALSQRSRPRRMRPWLRQILRNEHRASHRAATRRQAREHHAAEPLDAIGLDDATDHARMAQAIRDALTELDAPLRRVLEAKFFDDRSAADIARSEGCPASTIRWRVQEGLRRMRSRLDDRFDGRPAWRGSMAAFAGMSLPEAAPPSGATSMIKTTMFKWVGAALLTAGAGTVAASQIATSNAATDSSDTRADGSERTAGASADSVSRRNRTADIGPATTARPSSSATTLLAAVAPDAEQNTDDPAPECDQECGECDGQCDQARMQLPAMDACGAEFPLDPHAQLTLTVVASAPDKYGHGTIESIEVETTGEGGEGLAQCIRDSAVGELIGVPPEFSGGTLHFLLQGEGDHAAEYQADNNAAPDTPTPREYAQAHGLPLRAEGDTITNTVVECAEFDCPFCDKARPTLDQLVDEHPQTGVYWMHNPLPVHPGAMVAAKASVAAHAQNKFWDMHERLFDHPERRSTDDMVAFAKDIGLDIDRFVADMNSDDTLTEIETQRQICADSGVKGTPSFFVDDRLLVGAQPYDAFAAMLDD